MRLTAFTDYSLRLLIYVASSTEGRATIGGVASAYGISESHLTKVAHLLGKSGILANVRGRRGGLVLARRPDAIKLGDVVRLTEGEVVPAACFDVGADRCVIERACLLRAALREAVRAFYTV